MLRRLVVTLVGCVAVFLAGEVSVRAIDGELPVVLDWHSPEAQRKVEQMDVLENEGGADVLFLGSSLANAGLVPEVFVTDAAAAGHPGLVAYNAGLSAGMPRITKAWAEEVALPRLQPRMVLIGLSSFDFSDHPSIDVFYDAFATSPAGQRALGEDGFLDRVDRWLDDRSELWRDKAVLRDPVTVFDAIRGNGPPPDPVIELMGPDGRTSYLQSQRFEDRVDDGGVGVPVDAWTLGRRNPQELEAFVEGMQDDGTTVVLIDMPVTDDFVLAHPRDQIDYDVYLGQLRELADRTGATLIEKSSLRDYALFADEVHLNIDGATRLTHEVVAELAAQDLLPEPR